MTRAALIAALALATIAGLCALAGHHESDLRDERDRLAGNRREPRDLDWDRSVDSYRAVGWDDEPGDYERMFFESGWRAAIRALDGADS